MNQNSKIIGFLIYIFKLESKNKFINFKSVNYKHPNLIVLNFKGWNVQTAYFLSQRISKI